MARGLSIPSCSHCAQDSIIHQRYSGQNLCAKHLEQSIRKKFNKALREQLSIPKKERFRILVAISGGKDSAVLLERMFHAVGKIPHVEIIAGCIDEGIEGYRKPSMVCAQELCKQLGIRFESVQYTELGFEEMDKVVDIMEKTNDKKTPCAYCGVFRRQGINQLAKKFEVDVIALGHNLDDMAQTVLMNIQNGDMERTLRLAPHTNLPIEGMIPRIVPLRWIPEKEIHLYATHKNLPLHHEDCPHGGIALRFRHRGTIAQMELEVPGTRHGLLKFADSVKQLHRSSGGSERKLPTPCEECDEFTNGTLCKACEMKIHLGISK